MFTGIVMALGTVEAMSRSDDASGDTRLTLTCPGLEPGGLRIGDSVAVDGVCLTAVQIDADGFAVEISDHTLRVTSLARLAPGARVNLEPALTLAQPLGGHLVSGHIDGLAHLLAREPAGASERMTFEMPAALSRYVAGRGSVCLDGVSLTVNAVGQARFEVNLIPHTLAVTTLGRLAAGDAVNLEVDLVARYLERLLQARD